ncbi:MAG: bifunctional phosphoribosyl-AMP cyclohydrolase/phosphoribosyl-ATP pyrophosphatase [Candidatus Reconcilbacillus cellulovorans]|uniref:Histidine biosynthesis bifunctional protein HisIE n=1 Tax=Candidatus Reconcilbacillus cellulovorans TaxID=1906605 RepID=A0A2A6E2Y8_9BACL|nr:MAG: bifunctional phosphoribosyl-AMP cyclohydrolase/phosphoribosyl-ATP pyrophosphatase [Candidatus Reconcilbacillus cellulovorans]
MTAKEESWIGDIRWDERGLVPAIVQDDVGKDVLMIAYMNAEALRLTLDTGEAWFYSRSRGRLWRKGETSGNVLKVRSVALDCDGDALLVRAVPAGPACHTGSYSCFAPMWEKKEGSSETGVELGSGTCAEVDSAAKGRDAQSVRDRFRILSVLEGLIAAREAERPEGSYTTYLFRSGLDKILKKVGEESAEVLIAAKNGSRDELRWEVADLLFHLLVLLRERKLSLDDVMRELARRHAGPSD